MKRKDLIRYIEKNGCKFLREGGDHTVYVNRKEKKVSTIPQGTEKSMNIWQEGFARTSQYHRHNNRVEATAKRGRASPSAFEGGGSPLLVPS